MDIRPFVHRCHDPCANAHPYRRCVAHCMANPFVPRQPRRRRGRRASFHSIVDLQAAINRYINAHNADPKPFTWTKPAGDILAKMNASVH